MTDSSKAIFKAAKSGDGATVRALLAADAGLVHARDADASTPLHYAVWKGHRELVALLLAAGADVNARNTNEHWGTTPLHAAAHANEKAIALRLLEHGADAEARDGNGRTPLDHTAFHKANATAKLLREHAAR
jgi:ankyrin repeat protein